MCEYQLILLAYSISVHTAAHDQRWAGTTSTVTLHWQLVLHDHVYHVYMLRNHRTTTHDKILDRPWNTSTHRLHIIMCPGHLPGIGCLSGTLPWYTSSLFVASLSKCVWTWLYHIIWEEESDVCITFQVWIIIGCIHVIDWQWFSHLVSVKKHIKY